MISIGSHSGLYQTPDPLSQLISSLGGADAQGGKV